jgi:hypothetical protein
MSRLSDLITDAVESARVNGAVIVHNVASSIIEKLDPADRDQITFEGLCRRIKAAAERGRAEVLASAGKQAELPFNLPRSYAIDINDRTVKLTRELTEIEVRRVIAIRESSIAADLKSVAEIKRAYDAVKPIWRDQPGLLFGDVLDMAAKSEQAA